MHATSSSQETIDQNDNANSDSTITYGFNRLN